MNLSYSSQILFDQALNVVKNAQAQEKDPCTKKIKAKWNNWVIARIEFGDSAINATISTARNIVRTVYNFFFSATVGLCFTNSQLRNRTVDAANDTLDDLLIALKSLAGVLWPILAKKIQDWLNSKNQKEDKPKQAAAAV